ncbi:MAG: hypothetical protein LUD01_01390 [Clostridiales bacterium]|nr:hypothetical protein [Clostridiales bacterium]
MKLKLQKVKSYKGIVRATQKAPYVTVDAETGAKLVATGYFVAVEEEDETEAESDDDEDSDSLDYEALAAMTKMELAAYAEKNGISIAGCKTKAEILKTVSVANGGNSTMIDLQAE